MDICSSKILQMSKPNDYLFFSAHRTLLQQIRLLYKYVYVFDESVVTHTVMTGQNTTHTGSHSYICFVKTLYFKLDFIVHTGLFIYFFFPGNFLQLIPKCSKHNVHNRISSVKYYGLYMLNQTQS